MIWVADLEADGLLVSATRVWCGVFKNIKTGELRKFRPNEIDEMLSFMDTCEVLVFHNGTDYDFPLLKKLYNYEYGGKKVDTLLMSRLQQPERKAPFGSNKPHSIEAWGIRFGHHKPEHEDWTQFSEEMLHRCTEDVHITHKVLKYLIDEGKGHDWKRAHILTRDMFEVLQLQEEYGWLFDQEYADKCISLLTHWISRIDRILLPVLPMRLNILEQKVKGEYKYVAKPFLKDGSYAKTVVDYAGRCDWDLSTRYVSGPYSRICYNLVDLGSNDQTKEYLLGMGWVPEVWNYSKKTGERTSPKLSQTDEFIGVSGFTGKLMAKRVVLRHRRSQMQGWIDRVRPDGRVAQRITGICTTGRLKHSGIVNVPGSDKLFGKPMRKVFSCREGYKIVGVDSAGCQNRMLAARVGDPNFTEILINGDKEKGTSIHQINQKAILKYAGFEPPYKISKNLNYAFMFGATDPKLASTANVPVSLGPKIREGLLSVSPGFKDLVDSLTKEWRSTARVARNRWGKTEYRDGYVVGLDGRPILIREEHKILVFVLQCDEAILMQTAVVLLHRWLQDRGWIYGEDYGFCAHAHDEFQAEVKDDRVQEYKELAELSITQAGIDLGIQCPHEGEADVGLNWLETH
jgi:hypothetical protein